MISSREEKMAAKRRGTLALKLYNGARKPMVQGVLLALLCIDLLASLTELVSFQWLPTCSAVTANGRCEVVDDASSATPNVTCDATAGRVRVGLSVAVISVSLVVGMCFMLELLALLYALRGVFFRNIYHTVDFVLVLVLVVTSAVELIRMHLSEKDEASFTTATGGILPVLRVVRLFRAGALTAAYMHEVTQIARERRQSTQTQSHSQHLQQVLYEDALLASINAHTPVTPNGYSSRPGSRKFSGDVLRRAAGAAHTIGAAALQIHAPHTGRAVLTDAQRSPGRTRAASSGATSSGRWGDLRGDARLVEIITTSGAKPPPSSAGASRMAQTIVAATNGPPTANNSNSSSFVKKWEEPRRPQIQAPEPLMPSVLEEEPSLPPRPGDPVRALLRADSTVDHTPAGVAARRERAASAASRLRAHDYTLQAFHEDMLFAFPELRLYMGSAAADGDQATSGRTSEEEYLRTIGALFAVYWLMRLDLPGEDPDSKGLDGQRGFCFGVDEAWQTASEDLVGNSAGNLVDSGDQTPAQKRNQFFVKTDWLLLQRLLFDAGMLIRNKGHVEVVVERTVAMLALTAIHDIMKVVCLLPEVAEADDGYHGMTTGAVIHDHDLALGYVLQKDGAALPSFDGLPPRQRAAVMFTQAELGFNHGWLVQAEAPPGPLFGSMKKLLNEGGVESTDIAFYFVHWITDLAGAVPTPASGMEKFVLKFPQQVFVSLVSSMGLVQRLAHTPPAQLFLDFLQQAWKAICQKVKSLRDLPAPDGVEGWQQRVALMRLVVQAQTTEVQHMVSEAWQELPALDRHTLGAEMSLTGVAGEPYDPTPDASLGPAFLIYYSPAFVKVAAHDNAVIALRMLAEIYRAARTLWPSSSEAAGTSVTVHIGKMRGLKVTDDISTSSYLNGRQWVLVRTSDQEGVVQPADFEDVLSQAGRGIRLKVLRFWMSHWAEEEAVPTSGASGVESKV